MPKNEIGSYLEAKLVEGEVLREFETIPKKKLSSDVKSLFKTATMAENVPRNRFKDVLPYDDNRVRLAGGDKVIMNHIWDKNTLKGKLETKSKLFLSG